MKRLLSALAAAGVSVAAGLSVAALPAAAGLSVAALPAAAGLSVAALPAAAGLSVAALPAAAGTADYILPQRWNDDYQPGLHCATPGETGAYVTATRRWFDQTDAASVANRNAEPIPVKQTVTQARTSTLQVSATVTPKGDIEKYLSSAYGFNYTRIVHWSLGQTVGPYQLPANKQGKLVWGFMMLDADVQDVRCSPDQSWQPVGQPYSVTTPESRYAELRLDDAPVFN
ncbi:hypothetical protein [Corynebacterium epidermidicanis]|uniref:Secreted protein n=1 Tax=Corynebacterium epidermidicanis TaxID=1050174 RepID=A0A0G3GN70_9CORY|nr:hypothetical protein [Corynebacterium epidermidicanis]AKK02005.1 hypothetical protein CEPID_00555 [Corynebacterium epidermidicanis]